MKKAIIITCFDNYCYEVRMQYVEKYLQKHNYETVIYSSDFNHRTKKKYTVKRNGLKLINVPKYQRNLSIKRIYSHYIFSKKVFQIIKNENPEILYVSTPPNFLFLFASGYKKNHTVKLIYEIGDLWPETLPLTKHKKQIIYPFLYAWSYLRNKYIKYADGIICECNLFKEHLKKYVNFQKICTIYLSKEDSFDLNMITTDLDVLRFAYIGSINNIIDIPLIISTLIEIKNTNKIEFHIIGDGEQRNVLLDECARNNIITFYHGCIFDDQEKQKIISQCQFAFNIMKDSVFVGATMKSLEYFHYGLVLINNINGDTSQLIDEYNCGFNINKNNYKEVCKKINEIDEISLKKMKINSRNVYKENFSLEIFNEKFSEFINKFL